MDPVPAVAPHSTSKCFSRASILSLSAYEGVTEIEQDGESEKKREIVSRLKKEIKRRIKRERETERERERQ